MAKWIYCYDNKSLPPLGKPVVCIFHKRNLDKVYGILGVACTAADLFEEDKIYWIDIGKQTDNCQPYAYLDMDIERFDQEFLHQLVKFGSVKL